jgi:hypothetical protein
MSMSRLQCFHPADEVFLLRGLLYPSITNRVTALSLFMLHHDTLSITIVDIYFCEFSKSIPSPSERKIDSHLSLRLHSCNDMII